MIDALIRVVDRLIQLREYQDRRLKELHKEILKPTFDELLQIHKDYLLLFERTSQLLPSMEFLCSPVVAWKCSPVVAWEGEYYVIFDSLLDAQRFMEAEKINKSAMATLLLSKQQSLRFVPQGATDPITLYFQSVKEAKDFANQRNLGAPAVVPALAVDPEVLVKLSQAYTFVKEARLQFSPVRTKLKALSKELKAVDLGQSVNKYIASVLWYFPDGAFDTWRATGDFAFDIGRANSSGATQVLSVLHNFEGEDQTTIDPFVVNEMVSEVGCLLHDLVSSYEESWNQVAESYAGLTRELVNRG